MRVLLDEQLDRRLKPLFDPAHEITTVHELNWTGLSDRQLLLAAQERFEAFVTMDRGIQFQQNVRSLDLGIIILRAFSNSRPAVDPVIPKVNEALATLRPGTLVVVGP